MADNNLVHIIDDDESVRRSTGFMLKRANYQVQTYETGPAFLHAAKELERGCVLLDVRMPEMDGLEVQQAMAEMGLDMPVIIITGHADVGIAIKAMRAGAVNFIEKPYAKEDLVHALDEGFARLAQQDRLAIDQHDALARLACLTGREHDVLAGLVRGLPNKTIAYDLGISPRTVEIYRANVMEKLRVRSLAQALRIAFIAEGAL